MDGSLVRIGAGVRERLALPVAMKEMRSRMRGYKAPVTLFITTSLLIIAELLVIFLMKDHFAANDQRHSAEIGRALFGGLIALEALCCWFITPALTAGAFSLEREQQTLEMLLLTRLSDWNIVCGKLLASLNFVLLILFCALPFAAIPFFFGGVAPSEIAWALAIIIATVILLAAIGLYCSATFKNTGVAVTMAYGIGLGWIFTIPLTLGFGGGLIGNFQGFEPAQVVFTCIVCLIYATVPSVLISGLDALIFRRAFSHFHLALLWLVLGTLLTAIVFLPHYGIPLEEILPGHGNKLLLLLCLVLIGFLVYRLFRQAGGLAWFLLILGVLSLIFFLPVSPYEYIQHHGEAFVFMLTGNPPTALLLQYFWSEITSSGMPPQLKLFIHLFVPLTISLQLLLAAAYLVLTTRRLGALRRK